jgi:hypothetical protein
VRFANRDDCFDPDSDERFHRELFADLLHCLITRRGGTYAAAAARSGYSYRYLKYVRDRQRPVPPPEAVERIIGALPDPSEGEARALRWFARRAAPHRERAHASARLTLDPVQIAAELDRLLDAYRRALVAGPSGPDRRGFPELLGEANRLLGRIRRLDADPFTSARLFTLRSHLSSILDDPGAALKAARIARIVLDRRSSSTGHGRSRRAILRVESFLAEAVAFQTMEHDRLALDCYHRADQQLATRSDERRRAYVALGRASALSGTRRFRIGEVRALIDEVYRACDGTILSDAEGILLRLRAQGELANAYVRHGDLKPRTGRLVRDALERVDRVALAGPIHRARLYRIAAAYYAAQGDAVGRHECLAQALATARAGGLVHLVRTLEAEGAGSGVALAAD